MKPVNIVLTIDPWAKATSEKYMLWLLLLENNHGKKIIYICSFESYVNSS